MTTRVTRHTFTTAGASVSVRDETGAHGRPVLEAAGLDPEQHPASYATGDDAAAVRLVLTSPRRRVDPTTLRPVTRGVWSAGDGDVVVGSAGGSGFAQRWRATADGVEVRSSWSPSAAESAAAHLRGRFRALRGQVLLHYPALWWAGVCGLAPLHVSVLEVDGTVVLLAGPGGVGKSTLVAREMARGARVTCDNLAVSDGRTAFGLREPLRLPADAAHGHGAPSTHGRREHAWDGHVPSLVPDLVVVVSRGGDSPRVREVSPAEASRALVAGTLAAGELRRYWALQAVLGLATGLGPVQPQVTEVADRLTASLPCFSLDLGRVPGPPLPALLADQLGAVRQEVQQ